MCIALATIMLVWFGVQESLRLHPRRPRAATWGSSISFFMLITFAYTLVRFYDSSIPGVGQSFRGFLSGECAGCLVSVIGSDSITSIQNTLNQAQATSGTRHGEGPDESLLRHRVTSASFKKILIASLRRRRHAPCVAHGAIAERSRWPPRPRAYIPFLVFDKLEFLLLGDGAGHSSGSVRLLAEALVSPRPS